MLKKGYIISYRTGKNTTSQTPSATLDLEGWTRYFRHRHYIKMKRIKRLLNLINALWKHLMLHSLQLILNFDQDIVIKIYEDRTMKISSFNYSMPGYI